MSIFKLSSNRHRTHLIHITSPRYSLVHSLRVSGLAARDDVHEILGEHERRPLPPEARLGLHVTHDVAVVDVKHLATQRRMIFIKGLIILIS